MRNISCFTKSLQFLNLDHVSKTKGNSSRNCKDTSISEILYMIPYISFISDFQNSLYLNYDIIITQFLRP